jgi:acyl carrier protein
MPHTTPTPDPIGPWRPQRGARLDLQDSGRRRMTAGTHRPESIETRVLRVVQDVLALEEVPRDLDVSIGGELALDSLDQLSLFMALEDEFGGRIREEDAEQINTLRDVVSYVRDRMSTAPAG